MTASHTGNGRRRKTMALETSQPKSVAQLRGERRTEHVSRRIAAAIDLIRTELRSNQGVYLHNNGKVGRAEIARRAGVDKTTIHTAAQKPSRDMVEAFLTELAMPAEDDGRPKPKRSIRERLADWKTLYLLLEQTHQLTELELQEMKALRDDACKERDHARTALSTALVEKSRLNEEFRRLMSSSIPASQKVVPLRRK